MLSHDGAIGVAPGDLSHAAAAAKEDPSSLLHAQSVGARGSRFRAFCPDRRERINYFRSLDLCNLRLPCFGEYISCESSGQLRRMLCILPNWALAFDHFKCLILEGLGVISLLARYWVYVFDDLPPRLRRAFPCHCEDYVGICFKPNVTLPPLHLVSQCPRMRAGRFDV